MATIKIKDLIKIYGLDWSITLMSGLTLAALIDANTTLNIDAKGYLSVAGTLWLLRTLPNASKITEEATRRYMGLKDKQTISAPPSRAARLRSASKGETIFFSAIQSVLPVSKRSNATPAPKLPDLFLVQNVVIPGGYPLDFELIAHEVDHLIVQAWKRQMYSKPPFARAYWPKSERWPKRKYYAGIKLLLDTGLIINRAAGRSGQLVHPPHAAKRHVRWAYALTH